jgi:hypothetical protein
VKRIVILRGTVGGVLVEVDGDSYRLQELDAVVMVAEDVTGEETGKIVKQILRRMDPENN